MEKGTGYTSNNEAIGKRFERLNSHLGIIAAMQNIAH
jgi:hypothetical protein